MQKIGYLGPKGSYSYLAAERMCPEAEKIAYDNFRLVMKALVSGECDGVVAPIENSLNGGVLQNIDLLQSTEGVCAVGECTVAIDHRLAVLPGADRSRIKRIYSHQQALAQCGEYLAEFFPAAQQIAVSSTAASLNMLKSSEDACIVGAHTSDAGIMLSPQNIADEKRNKTQFLLIVRGAVTADVRSQKIYFSVTCRHEPGALLHILQRIADGGLNMTKIESRPIKDRPGEYRFFIEAEGDYSLEQTQKTLNAVRKSANSLKILGAY